MVPLSRTLRYRESPHSGISGSSAMGSALTCQPSGLRNRWAMDGPPRQGSAGMVICSGRVRAASSGRASHRPFMAVRNTLPSATASIEEAA